MAGWISTLLGSIMPKKVSSAEQSLIAYEKGVTAIGKGKTAHAIKYFTEAISTAPDSSKLYHHRADAFALNNQHLEAVVDYDVAVRLDPAYPDTYLDRGNSRYAIGDLNNAIKDFSEAIRLNPNWAEAHANRAVAYAERGDTSESDLDVTVARKLGVDEARLKEMLEAAHNNHSE